SISAARRPVGMELRNKLLNHPIVERFRNNPNWKPAADAAPDPILFTLRETRTCGYQPRLVCPNKRGCRRVSLKLRSNKVNSIGSRSLHRPQKVHGSFLGQIIHL